MLPEEVALLRSLVEWRRKNGWARVYRLWDTDQHDHTYEHGESGLSVEATMHRITLFPGEPKVVYEVGVDQSGHLLFHGWPWSVRTAVNAIGAAEVIPPEMAPMHSSAFAAGRESAYTRDGEINFVGWDHREQPEWDDLDQVLSRLSGGRIRVTNVDDTGSDQYAIAICGRKLTQAEATEAHDAWERRQWEEVSG